MNWRRFISPVDALALLAAAYAVYKTLDKGLGTIALTALVAYGAVHVIAFLINSGPPTKKPSSRPKGRSRRGGGRR